MPTSFENKMLEDGTNTYTAASPFTSYVIDNIPWFKQGKIWIKTSSQVLAAADEIDFYVQTRDHKDADFYTIGTLLHLANSGAGTNRNDSETGAWVFQLHGAMSINTSVEVSANTGDSPDARHDLAVGEALKIITSFTDADASASVVFEMAVLLRG